MEPHPPMDKKAVLRGGQLPSKGSTEPPVREYGGKKWTPQHVRKKEWERGAEGGGRRGSGWRGGRPVGRCVRPREKTGGKVELCDGEPESGSLYCTGGGKKRQNITHLLDWWGPNHRGHGARPGGGGGVRARRCYSHTPKYSKEHYLQANCQFVVEDGGDYSVYAGNQDLLVEWDLVEEVRLHVSTAPSCPICLHPPTAAKVTRCGHIYCFPCVLHYLALSDKRWRKCPICYEPIERGDLKSVVAVCHKDFTLGEEVELQLMRRERDSLLPVPASAFTPALIIKPPRITQPSQASPYAKLIVASKNEVQSQIVAREKQELDFQLAEEGEQPEACFIHQALELLRTRQNSLSSNSSAEDIAAVESGVESLALSSPDEPLSSSESFSSFDDQMSPLSPTLDPFPVLRDPEDGTSMGEKEWKGANNGDETKITGGNIVVTVGGDKGSEMVKGANDEKKETVTSAGSEEGQTVFVEDLDISQLQPSIGNSTTPGGQTQCLGPKPTFYFYQASNGAHVYLHSLNVKMLVQEYGSLEHCPPLITARLVEKNTVSMTEELRGRLRYLRHLPITCSFELAEVALKPPLVSRLTLEQFHDQVDLRQRSRNRRAREERKIEKRVQQEEDRMLGRSKGATNLKIESFKQFPSFCDEDFPVSGEIGGGEGSSGSMGLECVVSETSTSPCTSDTLSAASPSDTSTGISFAKMIREGQTRVSGAPHSTPASSHSSAGSVWPSLGGSAPPHTRLTGVDSNPWDGKNRAPEAGRSDALSEDEDEEVGVPEFKHAFSAAVARALDVAAARKSSATTGGEEPRSDGRKGKNKKKKKQVVLFSSGGLN